MTSYLKNIFKGQHMLALYPVIQNIDKFIQFNASRFGSLPKGPLLRSPSAAANGQQIIVFQYTFSSWIISYDLFYFHILAYHAALLNRIWGNRYSKLRGIE